MPSNEETRPLRRDAARNRQRLIDAAHEVFRVRGLSPTLDDVARHAGVGSGTAYRRFANKERLIDALFDDMMDQAESIALEAAADLDPWNGLASILERVCELQTFNRGLLQLMLGTGAARKRQELVARRISPIVDAIVDRAQRQGVLRTDIHSRDLRMIQLMVASVTDATGNPDLWRRYLHLILDGMRAEGSDHVTLPGIDAMLGPAGKTFDCPTCEPSSDQSPSAEQSP